MTQSISLAVGDNFHLGTGKDRIVYAGMVSDNVYSIAQRRAAGYQGYAWNLFYPKKKGEITIDGVNLFVENVTPDEIRLRVG